MPQTLIKKITGRSARIGVIGLGYVGLPLVIEFFKGGFDVDARKVFNGKDYRLTMIPARYAESMGHLWFLGGKKLDTVAAEYCKIL